jgi:drug/metabolite transporter (DMT)-like permease
MTSLYLNLVPVFAIAFGLMLDEKPTGLQMLGGAMVIGAVLQMQVRRLREHQGS